MTNMTEESKTLFVWRKSLLGFSPAIIWDNGLAQEHSMRSKEVVVHGITLEQAGLGLDELVKLFPPPPSEQEKLK